MSGLTPRAEKNVQNEWINGGLDFWQRGTTFTSIANAAVCADRLRYLKTGSMVVDVNKDTSDFPTFAQSGFNFAQSMRVNITTAQPSLGTSDKMQFYYPVEGYDYQKLHGGKTVRLQLWIKINVVGTYSISLMNSASNRSYVGSFSISAGESGAWVKKFVDLVTDNTGTWLFDSGLGAYVMITLAAGTALQTTPGVWNGSALFGATGQANFASSTSNVARMTGFMLTEIDAAQANSTALDFDFRRCGRTIGEESRLALRYYQHGNTNFSATNGLNYLTGGIMYGSTSGGICHRFGIPMRATPTVSTPVLSNVGAYNNGGGAVALTSLNLVSGSSGEFLYIGIGSAGGWTGGNAVAIANTSGTYGDILFDAEL
jgi:hypothetical protein